MGVEKRRERRGEGTGTVETAEVTGVGDHLEPGLGQAIGQRRQHQRRRPVAFTRQQEQMRQQFASGQFPGIKPGGYLEDQVRQNLAMFDRAMKMFSPFSFTGAGPAAAPPPAAEPAKPAATDDTLDELRKQMAAMQQQIEKLAKG